MAGSTRTPPRNLASYWQMEAANVVIVPGLALALGFPRNALEAMALGLAIAAAAGFLVVGAAYWRAVDRRLRLRDTAVTARALALADRVERPLIVICGLAIIATLAALSMHGWTRTVVAAAGLSVLAALEYVNYYHRQLQNFDHAADFKRLLAGRGLKVSHMGRELAAWRAAKSSVERGHHVVGKAKDAPFKDRAWR